MKVALEGAIVDKWALAQLALALKEADYTRENGVVATPAETGTIEGWTAEAYVLAYAKLGAAVEIFLSRAGHEEEEIR